MPGHAADGDRHIAGRIEVLLRGARRLGYGGVATGEDGRHLLARDRLPRGNRDLDVVTAPVAFMHEGVPRVGPDIVAPHRAARAHCDRDA